MRQVADEVIGLWFELYLIYVWPVAYKLAEVHVVHEDVYQRAHKIDRSRNSWICLDYDYL
jgi:hypothetical protein